MRRVYAVQSRVIQFAEDISYPKTKKGRFMTWLTILLNITAIGAFIADTDKPIER